LYIVLFWVNGKWKMVVGVSPTVEASKKMAIIMHIDKTSLREA
jgi:hypothetical protein